MGDLRPRAFLGRVIVFFCPVSRMNEAALPLSVWVFGWSFSLGLGARIVRAQALFF